jgi:hypothetical protein
MHAILQINFMRFTYPEARLKTPLVWHGGVDLYSPSYSEAEAGVSRKPRKLGGSRPAWTT